MPKNYPDITFNENGICNLCLNEKPLINFEEKRRCKQEFEEYVEKIKGKGEYDCLLLFSGGKDSTYLLYVLKEKYGLNVLAVTVDTALGSSIAKINIKKCVDYFNVDHITVTPENNFYKRLYRYYIQHPNGKTHCENICGLCQKSMHSIGLNIAVEKKIPFVALAYSPDQTTATTTYEFSKDIMSKDWIPKDLYREPFTEKDRSYFWNPEGIKTIPRFILPFYVLKYPGGSKIIEELSEIGLGAKRTFNPFKSNCDLYWLLIFLDIKRFNYNPYIEHLCRQIRLGKTNRGNWPIIISLGTWLLKHGFVKRKETKHALNYIDLTVEDCI